MTGYLVVEGPQDQILWTGIVKHMLPKADIQVIPGGGKYNAISLAETLVIRRQAPVAFVVDADTTDATLADQQKQEFETLLGLAGSHALWCVELFLPEMETCFFADPGLAEAIFTLDVRQRALVEFAPKRVFIELVRQRWGAEKDAHRRFIDTLSSQQWSLFVRDSTIAAVLSFFRQLGNRSAA